MNPTAAQFVRFIFSGLAFALASPGFAADGTLDPTFSGNGVTTENFDLGDLSYDRARAVAVQWDGKVVAAGLATWTGTDADFAVVRLNADGTPDATFAGDGRAVVNFDAGPNDQHWFDQGFDVALQPDGRIVVCGTVEVDENGTKELGVVRLEADGDPDPTWNGTGRRRYDLAPSGDSIDSCQVVAQRDGKIAVAWHSESSDATGVTRLLGNSNPDLAWPGGTTMFPCEDFEFVDCDLTELLELPAGRLATAGTVFTDASNRDLLYAVVSSGGGFGVTTYDGPPETSNEWAFGLGLQSDGGVILGFGQADTDGGGMRALRFPANSLSIDPDFGADGVAQVEISTVDDESFASDIVVGSDDRIVVVGDGYDETRFDCLAARFLPDGENVDASFGVGGRVRASFAAGIVEDSCLAGDAGDGRVVLAGYSFQQSDYDFAIARFTGNLVFRDGFENSSTYFWSSSAP